MSLLQFPNEIIEQILYHVRNADLDCFAASCWSLRVLATERLREHAKRKAQKLTAFYGPDEMNLSSGEKLTYAAQNVHPAPFIRELLNTDGFPYVQDLIMIFYPPDEWDKTDSVTFHSREDLRNKRTEQFQYIKAGLQGADLSLDKEYNTDRLAGRLLDADHQALLPILFTLAKRLRRISLDVPSSIPEEVVSLVQNISHETRSVDTPEQPLSRLAHLKIQVDFHEDFFDLGQIEPFLRLPSIKSLDLQIGQLSPWCGRDFLDFKSSLSSLNLEGYFKLRVLKQLLGNISNLRDFRCCYSTHTEENERYHRPYRGPYHGKKVPFNPRPIRNRLLQHARHSLEHLKITQLHAYKYTTLGLGSLKGFEKLKSVVVGSDMFNDIDYEERADGKETHSPYSFTHMLPSTIRKVVIVGPAVDESRIFDATEGATTWKHSKFPQLTEIEFHRAYLSIRSRQSEMIRQHLEMRKHTEMLKDAGISLRVPDYERATLELIG